MLRLYLQEREPDSLRRLAELCGRCLRFEWDARVEYCAALPGNLMERVRREDFPALFLIEDTPGEELKAAVEQLRHWNSLHYLVLLLHTAKDALRLRPPYFRPSGYLLKPVEKEDLSLLLDSVYDDFSAGAARRGDIFNVRVRAAVYPVPYKKILYFESRGKKIAVRTAAQEYEFYGSLEEISSHAPEYFRRIHKSFCVNMEEVKGAVDFRGRTVTLPDGSVLPFSRRFKAELAGLLNQTGRREPKGGAERTEGRSKGVAKAE